MSDNSAIQWTDASWNPTRGCKKVSPGCRACYAEAFAERFRGAHQTKPDPDHKPAKGEKRRVIPMLDERGQPVPHAYHDGFDPRLVPDMLGLPLTWKRGRKIFVNSMSDLFMDEVPDSYIDQVLARMLLVHRHTYQVLTKRADRMAGYFTADDLYRRVSDAASDVRAMHSDLRYVFTNAQKPLLPSWLWLGVSVEDKKYGMPRIEHLRRVPAAVRFLSVEPLLEDIGTLDLTGIHWVVVGGESGIRARKCEVEWIRNVVAQCKAAAVPVFVKQLGARATDEKNGIAGARLRLPQESAGLVKLRLKDSKGGEISEWPEDLRIQQMPIRPTL
jgi:protein gp37